MLTKRLHCLFLPPLLAAIIAAVSLGRGVVPHPDEPLWIGSAYYFDLLVHGDLDTPDWRLLPARDTPPVGKYLFGAVLWIRGLPVRSMEPLAAWYERWGSVPGAWGAGPDKADREAVANRLGPALRSAVRQMVPIGSRELLTTRLLAAAFGVVCALAVAALGYACRGPGTGLLAGVVFAVHPLAVEAYTHALFDIIALAFSLLAILGLIALLRSEGNESSSATRSLGRGLLTGVWLALAVGTKMNALIVLMVTAALAVVLAVRAWLAPAGRTRVIGLAALGLALMVSLILFIAINPSLYPDVPGGLRELFVVPARTTRLQASFLPDYLATPSARLRTVGELLCGHPAGLVILAVISLWPTRHGLPGWFSTRSVVVLWWWMALVAITIWIPFPWPRYALPVLAPAAVLFADALVTIAGTLSPDYSRTV